MYEVFEVNVTHIWVIDFIDWVSCGGISVL